MIARRDIPAEVPRRNGHCEMCGEFCGELFHIVAYGYDNFVCEKCRRKIQERIKRRYMTAGEHTEPAE